MTANEIVSRIFAFHSPIAALRSPFLPGTVTRVETLATHRKQTIGYASTRNVPAHVKLHEVCLPAAAFDPCRVEDRSKAKREPTFKSSSEIVPLLLTSHQSRITNHVMLKGGTVNRPSARLSDRKQKTGHMQGRNFPVHFLFCIFARESCGEVIAALKKSRYMKERMGSEVSQPMVARYMRLKTESKEAPSSMSSVMPGRVVVVSM